MSSQLPSSGSSPHNPPLNEFQLLLEQAQDIQSHPESYTPQEIAGVALALAQVFSQVSQALEPIKDHLRNAARVRLVEQGKTQGKVIIEGETLQGEPSGEVSVTFPASQVKLSSEFDPASLKELLGDSLFASMFEVKTTYKPSRSFKAQMSVLGEGGSRAKEYQALQSSIEHVEPTPRVGFPSARS